MAASGARSAGGGAGTVRGGVVTETGGGAGSAGFAGSAGEAAAGGAGTGSKRSPAFAGRAVKTHSATSKACVLAAATKTASGFESVIST